MRYRIYGNWAGPSAMNSADAKTGDGTPMDDFHRSFDGSVPQYDFELPDGLFADRVTLPDVDYGFREVDRDEAQWELAKVVERAFRAGYDLRGAHNAAPVPDPVDPRTTMDRLKERLGLKRSAAR